MGFSYPKCLLTSAILPSTHVFQRLQLQEGFPLLLPSGTGKKDQDMPGQPSNMFKTSVRSPSCLVPSQLLETLGASNLRALKFQGLYMRKFKKHNSQTVRTKCAASSLLDECLGSVGLQNSTSPVIFLG